MASPSGPGLRHAATLLISLVIVACASPSEQQRGRKQQHNGGLYVPSPSETSQVGSTPTRQHRARLLCGVASSNSSGDGSWECGNWAGTIAWRPAQVFIPEDEAHLGSFLAAAGPTSRFKVVGHGHSWAGLYVPPPVPGAPAAQGITIVLHKLSGITRLEVERGLVEVLTGTSFADLHQELDEQGLALAWQSGGIQGLTVGGAVSVGFHGSQRSLGSVSAVVQSMHVYDSHGHLHVLEDNGGGATEEEQLQEEEEHQQKLLAAARLGLGVCGILTRVTLPVVPQFYLRRRRWQAESLPGFLARELGPLKRQHDRFHYYIHPRSASIWPMTWEEVPQEAGRAEAAMQPCRTALEQREDALETEFGRDGLPLIMRWDNCTDVGYKAYTHAVDMEAQPLWNGEWFLPADDDAAEAAIVEAIQALFVSVGKEMEPDGLPPLDLWLHIRYIRGDDDIPMNPCHGWDVCAGYELALVADGMDAPLPSKQAWWRYFHPFEALLKGRGARPHWAKDHTVDPAYIATTGLPLADFVQTCARLDPEGRLGVHKEIHAAVEVATAYS